MMGLITEKDWAEINRAFPGIQLFYEKMGGRKPKTFLELEWLFLNQNRLPIPEMSENMGRQALLSKRL